MKGRDRRRKSRRTGVGTILEYGAGMAGLLLTLALAWFFPGWYSAWRDGQLAGEVRLQNRDDMQFLNTDYLDTLSSMKMLKDYGNELGFSYSIDLVGNEEVEILRKWETLIPQWREAGLLPLDGIETDLPGAAEEGRVDAQILNIYPQSHQGDLKVAVVRVIYPQATVVMDMERDQIYYLSVSGTEEVSDWMEGELEKEEPEGDFASVCQALSWSWETSAQKNLGTGTEGAINGSARLQYETMEGTAFRRVIQTEEGWGVAVMYGTEHWLDMVMEPYAELEGFYEAEGDFNDWLIQIQF